VTLSGVSIVGLFLFLDFVFARLASANRKFRKKNDQKKKKKKKDGGEGIHSNTQAWCLMGQS